MELVEIEVDDRRQEKSDELREEESANDPLFKRIADDYLDFRKKYAIWGEAQFVKPTYLKK